MAQLVALMSGVVLGGVVEVVGSNLATVGSVDIWCSARRCCRALGFESRYRQNIYSIYQISLEAKIFRIYQGKNIPHLSRQKYTAPIN